MNEHQLRSLLEGHGGALGALFRAAFWLPGKAYGLAMHLRREGYRKHILKSNPTPLPTISIGNLTAGGSGKTPTTALLAQNLVRMHKKPAILLRGYRQDAEGNSDEAALYRSLVPEALVFANPNRSTSAVRAKEAGADVLLMDDGFQHLTLQRHLDIVLVDATSPWGGGNTIPGGLLREPKSALRHATAIIVTRSNQIPPVRLDELKTEIAALTPGIPALIARHAPSRLEKLDRTPLPLERLKGKRVVALAGIARPEAFAATLTELGAQPVGIFAGRDHQQFDHAFVENAVNFARKNRAVVVTTEKDRAKKIFSDQMKEKTDKDSAGESNIREGIWVLGVDQRVEEEEVLMAMVEKLFH